MPFALLKVLFLYYRAKFEIVAIRHFATSPLRHFATSPHFAFLWYKIPPLSISVEFLRKKDFFLLGKSQTPEGFSEVKALP